MFIIFITGLDYVYPFSYSVITKFIQKKMKNASKNCIQIW